jgi:glycogen synthase
MPPDQWHPDNSGLSLFYTMSESELLQRRRAEFRPRHLAFCSFENRFGKSGGLAAVTVNILPYFNAQRAFEKVLLLTPYYRRLTATNSLERTGLVFPVPFQEATITVELWRYLHKYALPEQGVIEEYYLAADGFFDAENALRDPYLYTPNDLTENQKILLRNSMFYCVAVPYALQALRLQQDVVLHLQEWQTALLSLTSKEAMISGLLQSCMTLLTMHNPYDAYVSSSSIQQLVHVGKKEHISRFLPQGLTAYQLGLILADAPVTTVSKTFATEFTMDRLQTQHFAPHLQALFQKTSIRGINNGPFVEPSPAFPKRSSHTNAELKQIKAENRRLLLQVLDEYQPAERFGELSYRRQPITTLPDDVPILVMSGRLDLMQKGFDVLLRTMELFGPDEVKLVVTPLPTRSSDLDYFYEVACKCRGNVTVFPIRLSKGFNELQSGSTFGIMPSIYEPFGAAIEYMARGTVTIARKTGGLVDQIDDHKSGFLYREASENYTLDNIKSYMATTIVPVRKDNPWFESMAQRLYECISAAKQMYMNQPQDYYNMVRNGFIKTGEFDWSKSAQQYIETMQTAVSGASVASKS